MMSGIPIELGKVKKSDLVKEILHVGMIAELDAISLYEQLAAMTDRADIKKVLLDVPREEKKNPCRRISGIALAGRQEQVAEAEKGKEEVVEITGK